jgi:hypothetical protein
MKFFGVRVKIARFNGEMVAKTVPLDVNGLFKICIFLTVFTAFLFALSIRIYGVLE